MEPGTLDRLVEVFKVFNDSSRLRIVKLLTKRELCVSEIVQALGLAQPSVSQHLAKLRSAKLVRERREGQLIFYSIHGENLTAFEKSCRGFFDAELCDIPDMEKECECLKGFPEGQPFCRSKEERSGSLSTT